MNHSAQAEHVDLEHSAHLIFFTLFNGREIADARVVHEYVDAIEFILSRLDGRVDLVPACA
jgi:hypothetical protein